MMLPHTGWNAIKLNFQVSLFNELCAELGLHPVVCKYRETKESIKLFNSSTCM